MTDIKLRDGDSIDKALRIFKRMVDKAGIRSDLRKHEAFEKPSIRKKKKSKAARKRKVKQ